MFIETIEGGRPPSVRRAMFGSMIQILFVFRYIVVAWVHISN